MPLQTAAEVPRRTGGKLTFQYPFDGGFVPIPNRFISDLRPRLKPAEWGVFCCIFEELQRSAKESVILTQRQIAQRIKVASPKTVGSHIKGLEELGLIICIPSTKKHNGFPLSEFALDWNGITKKVPPAPDFEPNPFSLPALWYEGASYVSGPRGVYDVLIYEKGSTNVRRLPRDSREAIAYLVEQHRSPKGPFAAWEMTAILAAVTRPVTGLLLSSLAHTFAHIPTARSSRWYKKVIGQRCEDWDPKAFITRRRDHRASSEYELIFCDLPSRRQQAA